MALSFNPPSVSPPFLPQEFQVMYLSLGSTKVIQNYIDSIKVSRNDGGADQKTLALGYAGRVQGAAMTSVTCTGIIPAGKAFGDPGMQIDGQQLDESMLSALNAAQGLVQAPVNFLVQIGTAGQFLSFSGFINNIDVDVAVGTAVKFSFLATGNFANFQNP